MVIRTRSKSAMAALPGHSRRRLAALWKLPGLAPAMTSSAGWGSLIPRKLAMLAFSGEVSQQAERNLLRFKRIFIKVLRNFLSKIGEEINGKAARKLTDFNQKMLQKLSSNRRSLLPDFVADCAKTEAYGE